MNCQPEEAMGYAVIGLDNPKNGVNVGGALRACQVYGAASLIVGGIRGERLIRHPTDTMKAYRSIPVLVAEDVMSLIPYDCVPVAVDLIPDAISIIHYTHPQRAFYIFGAEDATLGKRIIAKCRDVIMIPTSKCMNLAATVNVVLYDRLAKQLRKPHDLNT